MSSIWLQGKDKTQSCKLNDKKTSEKFNNCFNKKKQNVQIIVLVNMKMCVKLRRKMFSNCIDSVAERKNFKLLFSAGIILPLGFQFIYFVQ